jgi:hypothetical protein
MTQREYVTTASDILGPLGDAIIEGTEDNLTEFIVEEIAYLDRSGRVIDPHSEWTTAQPTTMLLTTTLGLKFKITIEAVPNEAQKKDRSP